MSPTRFNLIFFVGVLIAAGGLAVFSFQCYEAWLGVPSSHEIIFRSMIIAVGGFLVLILNELLLVARTAVHLLQTTRNTITKAAKLL